MDLLFRLGRAFGDGVTRAQFRRIFNRCDSCRSLVYADRRHSHRCDGAVLQTQEDGFDLVPALLTYSEHAGLSPFDAWQMFTRCDACNRVCFKDSINLHDCPALDSSF